MALPHALRQRADAGPRDPALHRHKLPCWLVTADLAVAQLLQLNNRTVTDVAVSADNELRLVFDEGGATVTVDARPRAFTGDIWWLAAMPT